MTLSIDGPAGTFLAQVVITAVRTIALAAVTGLLLVVFRVKGASLQLFAWTAVLYAGLSMPVLAWLLPPITVRVPLLRSAVPVEVASDEPSGLVPTTPRAGDVIIHTRTDAENVSRRPQVDKRPSSWNAWVSSVRWTNLASAV